MSADKISRPLILFSNCDHYLFPRGHDSYTSGKYMCLCSSVELQFNVDPSEINLGSYVT